MTSSLCRICCVILRFGLFLLLVLIFNTFRQFTTKLFPIWSKKRSKITPTLCYSKKFLKSPKITKYCMWRIFVLITMTNIKNNSVTLFVVGAENGMLIGQLWPKKSTSWIISRQKSDKYLKHQCWSIYIPKAMD